ncbi:MAG: FG-GAP-like repeat-containing protein [Gemmatimonadales bacterium]
MKRTTKPGRDRPVGRIGALIALGLCACVNSPPPVSTEWHEEGAYRWRELAVPRRGQAGFKRLSASRTGIAFENSADRRETRHNQNLHIGSGVALGDADGDGLVDIYFASTEGPNVLYRNLGNWRFEDVTERAGVGAPHRFSTGAVFADVDGDGDLDLLTTATGGPNALYLNDGTGRFSERTVEAGLESDRASTTMTLADVDGDGDLDLYVANYKFTDVSELFTEHDLSFDEAVRQVGEDQYEVVPALREHFRFEKVNGKWVRSPRADPDWFYLNDGHGRFERISFTSGRFRDETGKPLARQPEEFGLAARFYDVDRDGDPDLYVCNDFEGPDNFWINDGTGRFRALPATSLRTTSNASMAVDFADIDRDGDVDFFVTDMLARDRRARQTHGLAHVPPKAVDEIESRPQWQRNTLLLNRGDATYAQIAEFAGVDATDWSWTTLFLDVDLDGYEDILVATGYTWDVFNDDLLDSLELRHPGIEWRDLRLLLPPLERRNVAFRNNGDLTFEEVEAWGFGAEDDISQGMAAGDLDGDGDLDVVVNRLDSPAGVFRNETNAKRVAVRLIGEAPNTQAVGAKIRVISAGPVQEKEVTLGGLYLSSSELLYAFAARDAAELTIEVDWRSGAKSIVRGAQPNRLYEIREPPESDDRDHGPEKVSGEHGPVPIFADVSGQLGHVHVDLPFNDFLRQPLLPNRLGSLGPGVSWYDVDSDGYEDLLIGAGRGGELAYYRNRAGQFNKRRLGIAEARYDETTVLAVPGTGGHGTVLLVGQSSYEAAGPTEALAAPSVLRVETLSPASRLGSGSATATTAVPPHRSSAGPLALADYDGDGDLDLFVGGRFIPVVYPAPASSRLFRNEGGPFVLDSANLEPLKSVGLVSSAVFSDIDGDGDPDLLLALEWGPIKLLLNDAGRFTEAGDSFGLSRYRSRWNGITTGDLDGDGRLDIVATSWGRNTRYHVDERHPLMLYYGDFDNNGSVDVVEAQRDDRLRKIAPLTLRSRMIAAMPYIRGRSPSRADYARSSVKDVLGAAVEGGAVLDANTLEHMVFLNRGGSFEPVPLPTEAQLAPAFYAGVVDFDGDGNDDLFLSQNFFDTERGTPRYDAGRGLWLKGDGTGALVPVPGQVSGITVYGEQRGAAFADFDRDGRVDLVVSQNANETKLFRNEGGTPGLRVRLVGSPGNPNSFGATIRLVYGERRGPAREIHAGSGYWSQDGPVAVLGKAEPPTAVWVRWPGGRETTTPVTDGTREVTIRIPEDQGGS